MLSGENVEAWFKEFGGWYVPKEVLIEYKHLSAITGRRSHPLHRKIPMVTGFYYLVESAVDVRGGGNLL